MLLGCASIASANLNWRVLSAERPFSEGSRLFYFGLFVAFGIPFIAWVLEVWVFRQDGYFLTGFATVFCFLPGLALSILGLSCLIRGSFRRQNLNGSENNQQPQRRKRTKRTSVKEAFGAVVLTICGLCYSFVILTGILFKQFLALAVLTAGALVLVRVASALQSRPLRSFAQAFITSCAFSPFIIRPSAEWSSPWPPASFSAFFYLAGGEFPLLDIACILMFTCLSLVGLLCVTRPGKTGPAHLG